MMRLIFFVLFSFFLIISIARADTKGAYSNVWFLVIPRCEDFMSETYCIAHGCYWYDDSCHSSPEGIPIEICTVKIPLTDDTELCITDDGEIILLVTASLTIVGIPLSQRKKIIKRLKKCSTNQEN